MTTPAHEHHWELAEVDPTPGGANARMVTLRCTGCDETMRRLTARTDAEIRAELDAQNA
jgi:hypothetical protein